MPLFSSLLTSLRPVLVAAASNILLLLLLIPFAKAISFLRWRRKQLTEPKTWPWTPSKRTNRNVKNWSHSNISRIRSLHSSMFKSWPSIKTTWTTWTSFQALKYYFPWWIHSWAIHWNPTTYWNLTRLPCCPPHWAPPYPCSWRGAAIVVSILW